MKNLWLIPLLLLAYLTSASAQTEEFPETSGNAFLRLCSGVGKTDRTESEVVDTMTCVGYVSGFTAGVVVEKTFAKTKTNQAVPAPFCVPAAVEHGQVIRIVLKYIRDNPEDAHKATPFLIVAALEKAYPCQNK